MQLSHVLEGVPLVRSIPPTLLAMDVRGLAYDSRKVEAGFLFFAFAGSKTDGARYAASALEKGALAIVSDRPADSGALGPWIQVPHGRE